MIVSIINLSRGKLKDSDIQTAIRAINRQVAEDFAPYWGFGGQLRLEGKANPGGRNDFLGARNNGSTLKSFHTNPGGYIGFFDPTLRKDDYFYAKHDELAPQRLRIKRRLGTGRGMLRRRRTLGR
jgi:hypothetical protein